MTSKPRLLVHTSRQVIRWADMDMLGHVEVRMYLGEPGRSSVGSFYELSMNDRKCADGAAKIVWIDLASGRSVPLPDAVASRVRDLR